MPSGVLARERSGQPRDRGRGVAYRVMMALHDPAAIPARHRLPPCDRRPRRASQPEPCPARGRRARCRRRARRSAAGDRRRGLGQDQHAGAPRRAPDRRRRRPRAHPAAHLLAPRRGGNGRRASSASSPRPRRDVLRWRARSCLVRHLPRHRRAAAARATPSASASIRRFTIHDREDSADLMNLVRHELGLSEHEQALSAEGDLPGDLLARRQRRSAAAPRCCRRAFPGARNGRASCKRLFAAYVEAKQAQHVLDYDDLLLYWAQMVAEPALARRDRRPASTTCWSTSTRTPTRCRPRSCWR